MINWNVENMALMNEVSYLYKGDERIFECELELSREEKITFVDSMQDGKLSYLLSLIDKYAKDSKDLPKKYFDVVKVNSLKAWIKRNDPRKLIDSTYMYGDINFFGYHNGRTIHNPHTIHDTYTDLVDEFFHRQLKECLKLEKEYFRSHDDYHILSDKLRDYVHTYGETFGVGLSLCSDGRVYITDEDFNNNRLVTMDEIKELLDKYDKLERFIEQLRLEVNIKY